MQLSTAIWQTDSELSGGLHPAMSGSTGGVTVGPGGVTVGRRDTGTDVRARE